jgi:hypothetical protein
MVHRSILDLPGPLAFAQDVVRSVGDGGTVVSDVAPLGPGLAQEFIELLESFEAGWSVRCHEVGPDGLAASLSVALRVEGAPVGAIAANPDLEGRVAVLELPLNADLSPKGATVKEAERFWQKRGDYGPDLILICQDEWQHAQGSVVPRISWAERRFLRIDRMIWALTHLGIDESPLADFAEALAVEVGGQDLELVSRIASAARIDLEHPTALLKMIAPERDTEDLEAQVWRSQVRAFLPWIEEFRQQFVLRYQRHLYIDGRQEMLRVRDVADIEIGGINHQLTQAGCLAPHEKDLLSAIAAIRRSVAHGKPCDPVDLSEALGASRRFSMP